MFVWGDVDNFHGISFFSISIISFDKLRAADGILLAFPASSTGVPTQIRAFFNSLHNLAKQNVLLGKLAGIASSPLSSTHGMELVRTELTTDMAHCGLISIPLKPSEKTVRSVPSKTLVLSPAAP